MSLAKGDRKTVVLELKPGATVSASPAAASPSGMRIAAYTTGALGIAGLLAGAATGLVALTSKDPILPNCGLQGDPHLCNPLGYNAATKVQAFGLASTIAFAVGGASLATGVVLLVVDLRPKGGAVVGLRGAW